LVAEIVIRIAGHFQKSAINTLESPGRSTGGIAKEFEPRTSVVVGMFRSSHLRQIDGSHISVNTLSHLFSKLKFGEPFKPLMGKRRY